MVEQYAVFLDFDGTLQKDGVIPARNREEIRRVREAGHLVFLNTGRSYGYIPHDMLADVPLDGIVAGGGTDLYLHGRQIDSYAIEVPLLREIAAHFQMEKRPAVYEGEQRVLYQNGQNPAAAVVTGPDDFDTLYRFDRISKLTFDGQLTPAERDWLAPHFILCQHPTYAEIIPAGFGKDVGMRRILALTGIPLTNSIAMGDSLNDTDMLRAAGHAVAMGDAHPVVREMCEYLSCAAAQGGVAQALAHLIPAR